MYVDAYTRESSLVNKNINIITMSTCDVFMIHFRKMLYHMRLRTQLHTPISYVFLLIHYKMNLGQN